MLSPDDIIAALFAELEEAPEPEPQAPAPPDRPARTARPAPGLPAIPQQPPTTGHAVIERLTTDELRRVTAILAEEEDRMEWPDWWWDQVDSGQHRAIRSLWASVLQQVVNDAMGNTQHSTARRGHLDAIAWLHGHRRDRAMICAIFDIDPDDFSERVLAFIETRKGEKGAGIHRNHARGH